MTSKIEQDSVASVHYTGTFPDGEVFDTSEGKDPLTFLVGHGQMIPGFEQEMMGAEAGEKREFTLTPDRAYGERHENAIQKASKADFGENADDLEVGMMMGAQTEQGMMPFTITEIDGDEVTIDFNHQMAGKTLRFVVEVIELRAASDDELAHGHVHGPGGHHH
jgi:FKBP-type peptidyl-prolyl cis-trans isomerase SlyD